MRSSPKKTGRTQSARPANEKRLPQPWKVKQSFMRVDDPISILPHLRKICKGGFDVTKTRTDIGYIAYAATADELSPIGSKGICDACGRYSYHGHLLPVLNSYYCPECYRDFCSRGTFYPEDIGHETKVAAYYESKIPLEGEPQ